MIIGNCINLQRIGRKLDRGEQPTASDYKASGNAFILQGGCMINESTVAYMLWDSINTTLDLNKLIIMNVYTGEVINSTVFNFGWCNSISYDNEILYIAERGNSSTSNNGIVHLVNSTTLKEISKIVLPINVNAISIYNNYIYVLEENTNKVKIYNLDGTYTNNAINLNIDIQNLYYQDIKVTEDYIYILLSKPSNLLIVYNHTGKIEKSIDIPTYGGIYFIGEPQFIDTLNGKNMILGSTDNNHYNEAINQFFKFNLVNNISTNKFSYLYTETLQVNATKDNYNPDGKTGNEFTSINETINLDIDNIVLECNNQNYRYTYGTNNKKYLQIRNATLTEGIYLQYGNYLLNNCTINYSINPNDLGCLYTRDNRLTLNSVNFNGNGKTNIINSARNSIIKFATCTFSNYTGQLFSNNVASIVNVNNSKNFPFVLRSNIIVYSLHPNGWTRGWKKGEYSYNTTLNANEIQNIIDGCSKVTIGYTDFNNSTKTVTLAKTTNGQYAFTDMTASNTSMLFRLAKIQLLITSEKYTIIANSNITYNGTEFKLTDSEDSSEQTNFIQIRFIEFNL